MINEIVIFNKKVQRVEKVLKIDGPSGRGFLSLMGHRPKGCGGALRAQFISFLRRPDHFARKTVQPRLRRGCTVFPAAGGIYTHRPTG